MGGFLLNISSPASYYENSFIDGIFCMQFHILNSQLVNFPARGLAARDVAKVPCPTADRGADRDIANARPHCADLCTDKHRNANDNMKREIKKMRHAADQYNLQTNIIMNSLFPGNDKGKMN